MTKDEEFDAFYRAHAPRLYLILLKWGASVADAADAAGHAFTEVYARWDQLRNPAGYVRRVAKNELAELANRPRTDVERALRGSWNLEAVETVCQFEEVQQVLAAFGKLPQRQREVMALHYDGYDRAEIAELLGLPLNTVYSNLRHAKETLRRLGVGEDR